ncbi:MAG: hypothetical protein ABJM43_12860 [Paracoccaceae bacterium]
MKRSIALLAFLTLTACGADGEPVKPTANLNIGVGSNGVHTGASIGLRKGPLGISLGQYL